MAKGNILISPVDVEARKKTDIKPGDTVRVWQKIKEGDKTRLQAFEGLVIARKHGAEAGGTFTVRKIASGVGVEKIFPLYSPNLDKVEVLKRSHVRRAKLYFVRKKATREIRKKMKQLQFEAAMVIQDKIREKEGKEQGIEPKTAVPEGTTIAETVASEASGEKEA